MHSASAAYSAGIPSRLGNGTDAARAALTLSGAAWSSGVSKIPRQDRVDADALAHQIARDRQGHADHPALRRRIGGLADLAILGRDRGGVDDRAALAKPVERIERHHPGGRLGDAAERADEVDLDDPVERIEWEMLDLAGFLRPAGGLDGIAGARAVDQDAFLAVGSARLGKACIDAFVAGHVDLAEHPADLGSNRLALVLVQVEQRDFHALFRQRARGCRAKARSAAGHHRGNRRIQLHVSSPFFAIRAFRRW